MKQLLCLFFIALFLLTKVNPTKMERKKSSKSRNTAEKEPGESHTGSYSTNDYPPLDMTEKDWPQLCSTGKEQTPIDLPNKNDPKVIKNVKPVEILRADYNLISGEYFANHKNKKWGMYLKNQGSLYVRKNGITYKYDLLNIHAHANSEHLLNGEPGDMEIHIVHLKDTKWLADQGVKDDPDKRNKALVLGTLWKARGNWFNPKIEELQLATGKPVDRLNLTSWANKEKSFYHYEGSLTTPDCNQFVNWVVYDGFNYMSKSQFESIKKEIFDIYPEGNGRKVKPLNNRDIYYVKASSRRRKF
jgi:carbonic anhydrase